VFVSTLLTFLAGYADRWIFGALIPLTAHGLYGNAVVFAALPVDALSHVAHQVVFPLYAKVVQRGGDLAATFHAARRPLQIFGGWALCGLVAGGPTAMRLLYDEAWWGSGWMIQVLAAGSWFLVCEATNGAAMLARGEPRWVAAGSLAKLVGMCAFVPLGWSLGGFPGALAAYAGTELFRYATSVWGVARLGLDALPSDLGLTVVVLAVGALGWQLAERIHLWGAPALLEALAVTVLVTLAWTPLAWKPIAELARARRAPAVAVPT
jgi:O-antigen/teichoic acid export membrane protein